MAVTQTYVMLMVSDMTRALKFYTVFDVSVSFDSAHWSEFTVGCHDGAALRWERRGRRLAWALKSTIWMLLSSEQATPAGK
jgi:hypothetical protein